MNPDFIKWIIEDIIEAQGPEFKTNFLRLLKERQDLVLQTISDNLMSWVSIFVAHTGISFPVSDKNEYSWNIMGFIQQHFEAELAAIR